MLRPPPLPGDRGQPPDVDEAVEGRLEATETIGPSRLDDVIVDLAGRKVEQRPAVRVRASPPASHPNSHRPIPAGRSVSSKGGRAAAVVYVIDHQCAAAVADTPS